MYILIIVNEVNCKTAEGFLMFQVFETLPDTVQEIDELICEEQSRLNCQFETDPQVY